ncbi:MAG: NUDIX domain-containing protein [Candidatus Uhrbacteria bacterium]
MRTVLTFGTFDAFHPGHEYVLAKAAALGDRLVVGVARDSHVRELKNKEPRDDERVRLDRILAHPLVSDARLSDEKLGSYEILDDLKPDVVAIGHDQHALRESLEAWMSSTGKAIPLVRLDLSVPRPIKTVPIAVALAMRDGKLLLLQRRDENPMWNRKWEFPGGKIESGEDPADAMRRELLEETGLAATTCDFLGTHTHDWDLSERILRVVLHCFRCDLADGDVLREDRAAFDHAWATPAEALTYDLLEANADLIRKFVGSS